MSIESWLKEFYPLKASEVPEGAALLHSLKKWTGFREKSLRRHRVTLFGETLEDTKGHCFTISGDTCSLCVHYQKDSLCFGCPLYKARGGHACDDTTGPGGSIYDKFLWNGDPEPMIRLLRKSRRQTPNPKP